MNENARRQPILNLATFCMFFILAACNPSADSPADSPATSDRPAASDSPDDSAQTAEPSRRAVVAETLAYAEVDEQLVKGHFVFPEDMIDPLPAIILIHEWWGLTDEVRALADRYAGEGYIVLAVDLFAGRTATTAPDARALMLEAIENPEFSSQNLRQACEWVLSTTGATQVATVGYGFGGGWSLNAAIELPDDVDAAVVFYGQVTDDESALTTLNAPILAMFGGDDGSIPREDIDGFQAALDSLGKSYEVEVYPTGKGGFASPGSRNFNSRLESITWERLTAFLRHHLVRSGG